MEPIHHSLIKARIDLKQDIRVAIHQELCPRKIGQIPPHQNHWALLRSLPPLLSPVWLLTSGRPYPDPKVYDLRPGTFKPLSMTCQHINTILIPRGTKNSDEFVLTSWESSLFWRQSTARFVDRQNLPALVDHMLRPYSAFDSIAPYSVRLTLLGRNLAPLD